MPLKPLTTTVLLLTSLNAMAQFDSIEHVRNQSGVHTSYESPNSLRFNDRFNNKAGQQWLLLAGQHYISKAQAINIAKQRSSGKVLSAKLVIREQQAFYKIKVLTDQGRIKTLRINAQPR